MPKKISVDDAKQIRIRYRESNVSMRALADEYDVSHQYINLVIRGEFFADAGGPILGEDYSSVSNSKKKSIPDGKIVDMRVAAKEDGLTDDEASDQFDVSKSHAGRVINGSAREEAGGPIAGEDYDRDSQSYRSKLDVPDDVIDIRDRLANGDAYQYELAEEYGVSTMTVSRIARGETHTDVGGPVKGEDYE